MVETLGTQVSVTIPLRAGCGLGDSTLVRIWDRTAVGVPLSLMVPLCPADELSCAASVVCSPIHLPPASVTSHLPTHTPRNARSLSL